MGKNQLTPYEKAVEKTTVVSGNFMNALSLRSAHHIETKVDSDGKEYLTARFALKAPTKKCSEIIVNDMAMATSLERLYNYDALHSSVCGKCSSSCGIRGSEN